MKPFLTYDQQVAKLRSKGLSVPNEDAAKATLADIGYFSLVNGYKRPLRDPSTRRYKPGASFEDVVARRILAMDATPFSRRLPRTPR